MTSTTTLVGYNVLFKNTPDQVEGDLHQLEKDQGADLMALNEAGPTVVKGVREFLRRMGWREFCPEGNTNRILWNPDVWSPDRLFGTVKLSDPGPVKYTPARRVVYQGLTHRPTGTRHLVYCTHITQGYAKDDPPGGAGQWRDVAARTGLLRLASLITGHMAERDEYGFHHLLGDLNCAQRNRDEWWYPHPLLEAAFVRDTMPKAIDYMLHSHMAAQNGLKVVKRFSVGDGLESDHRAQVKRIRLP